jgi:hypothetical protein
MSDIKATAVIHRSLMHKGPRVAPDMQETALCQFVAQWPPNLPEFVQISASQELSRQDAQHLLNGCHIRAPVPGCYTIAMW